MEIKLPIETFVHKEIYLPNAIYIAQPVGKLACVWFTIEHNKPVCFVIHNIFKYKNVPVDDCYSDKYKLMETVIEKYIFNEKMTPKQCMFFMPVTSFRIENIEASYKIFCIKIMIDNKIINYVDQTMLKPFWIQSTDVRDIYEIYTLENVYHSIAHIDTHKRSVMLNKLFKKEITIDSIEDSDDEELFESKRIKMYCKWNELMKKWIPIKIY